MIPTFPIAWFLIPYALFLIVYLIFFFFNSFHLRHFAIAGLGTSLIMFIYFTGTVLLLGGSLILITNYSWQTTFDLSTILQQLTSSSNPFAL